MNLPSFLHFVPHQQELGFKKWSDYGLSYVHQLVHKIHLKSLKEMQEEFGVQTQTFSDLRDCEAFKPKDLYKIINLTEMDRFWMETKSENMQCKVISRLICVFLWIQISQYV